MSVRRLASPEVQPKDFAFTAENLDWAKGQIAKYPEGRQASAVIPLLWKAQEQHDGWLPEPAIRAVAEMLGMAYIRVLEVATFYTMFNLAPVGEYFVQLCGTTPCALRGANALKDVCRKVIGPEKTVSADGKLSWMEVECLGACSNAPMAQINFDYYEDLDEANFEKLLEDLRHGRPVKTGSQAGRDASAPLGEATSLTDPSLYDGSVVGAWKARFEEEKRKAEEEAARKAAEAAAAKPAEAPAAPAPKPAEPAAAAPKPVDTTPAKAVEPAERSRPETTHEQARTKGEATKTGEPTTAHAQPAASVEPGAARNVEQVPSTEPVVEPVADEYKPALLAEARGGKSDDLKLIWGVGPKLEETLHRLGVFHFDQIAAWTDMNLRWVDQNLGAFKGRAVRDKWIDQAKILARGGTAAEAEKAVKG